MKAFVDEGEDGNLVVRVAIILRQHAVKYRLHQRRFLGGEKADRRHIPHACQHHRPRGLVPEVLLTQGAETGIIARLRPWRQRAVSCRIDRQQIGPGSLHRPGWAGCLALPLRHQSALRNRLASTPMKPLAANRSGANRGGPYIRLYSGYLSPPGRRSMPRAW